MSILKVALSRSITDKPYSKQAMQLKTKHLNEIECTKILAGQFIGMLK